MMKKSLLRKPLRLLSWWMLPMLAVLCSCQGRGVGNTPLSCGDTLRLKYAHLLQMVKYDSCSVVNIADPWNKGKNLHTYILVPADRPLPRHLPQGTVVRTPLRRTVVCTSVHSSLVSALGRRDHIKGVCDLPYINDEWIIEQCRRGNIADCGNGTSPTLEKIIDIDADAILISPFQNSGGYGRLDEWGNPIIETADYMETSGLGRAEWMKFYGMLYGAEAEADSMFAAVEQSYISLKQRAKAAPEGKTMLMNKQTSSVWYVPSGGSTIGSIIADAHAGYAFANDKSSGSLALPFEAVLEKSGQADVWIIRYTGEGQGSLAALLSENKGYAQFKAFKTGEVYGCDTNSCTFYEDTPFHPELLLRDFIIITHPEITDLGQPVYFKKMKKQ